MSGTDQLVAAINNAIPSRIGIPPAVGVIQSVGGPQGWMVAKLLGITAEPLDVPQKWFSSTFIAQVIASRPTLSSGSGGLVGSRVLVVFTEGNQPVILTTIGV